MGIDLDGMTISGMTISMMAAIGSWMMVFEIYWGSIKTR